jgi:hypothetical protein
VETTKALESKLPKKKKVSVRERSRTGPRQRGRTLAELTRKKNLTLKENAKKEKRQKQVRDVTTNQEKS